jgi:signal transduction histidine kinase
MQTSFSEVTIFTLLITTILILLLGGTIIYFLFLYQRKRYEHHKEIIEMRQTFNQTLLESKLEIQEQTLDHIAKELHSNFSHIVSLININLSQMLAEPDVKHHILETKSLAKQLLSELKALSASLNTDYIMNIGFERALNNELIRVMKIAKYKVEFVTSGEPFRLKPEKEIILFRLCQEVVNNIMQYAKATAITSSIVYDENGIDLSIHDDGVGFDVEQAEKKSSEVESTGLVNIRKRAKLIDGNVAITSSEGTGTVVRIRIPK